MADIIDRDAVDLWRAMRRDMDRHGPGGGPPSGRPVPARRGIARLSLLLRGAALTVLLPLVAALILAACDIPGHSHAGWPPGY